MFNKLKELYNKCSIPKEYKFDSYALSISKLSVIFKALFIFCLFELLLTFISSKMEQEMGGNIRWYYALFALAVLGGCISTHIWQKNKYKDKERAKKLALVIFIATTIFFVLLTAYEASTFDNSHNVIAIYIIISIGYLFVVDLNSILYFGIQLFIITACIPKLYAIYNNVSMIVNSYIFAVVMGYASYCFITKEVKRIQTENALKKYNEEIEYQVMVETNKRTQLQDDIIYSMADLVENRDIDTGAHIKRTSLFVEIIAEEAKRLGYYTDEITDEFINYLKKAMPLHDIGKIVIPDSILKAPRKLTTEEFEIMKTHTIKGAEIIENIFTNIEEEDYISYATNIAQFHHEWWNGEGYPCQLKNTEIPLVARIASIADVFDALVASRCYKSAYSVQDALKLMEAENGTHFDPKLFDAFMSAKDKIIQVVESDIRTYKTGENNANFSNTRYSLKATNF